jgi:predicted aminopeptidase
MSKAAWTCIVIALLGSSTAGCAKLGYYAQALNGQLQILSKRQPIDTLLGDPSTDPKLRVQLTNVLDMRAFASEALALPDNKSYRTYVDLERRYAVWNVFAAPELSLEPEVWCYPFLGCVSYRGYFSEQRAQKFADTLAQKNYDVYVAGIAAYSTLGWFHDPVLSTFLRRPEADVAGLIFHELAHQRVYLKGDTTFNESFAVALEREGVRRWLTRNGAAPMQFERYLARKKQREQYIELVLQYRERLQRLYASKKSDEKKRTAKARIFEGLKEAYRALKRSWGGYSGYDRWFARNLNNAHLVPIGLYHQYVPAFQALLAEHNGDFKEFYGAVETLVQLPEAERIARLESLQASRPRATSPPRGQ